MSINYLEYHGDDEIISSHEMKELTKSLESTKRYRSKIPLLDDLVGGFMPGELVTISGITKNGKTLFSQTLTHNFFLQGLMCLWFTYELPPAQFLSCFPDLPLLYMPKQLKACDMEWVEHRILEGLAKYHTRIVFIDHLHYLFDLARSKNTSLEIGAVIRRLKKIAVDKEIVIFLMCHTVKPKQEQENMGYEGIRDSSVISQESDVVLMLQRKPEHGDNVARLGVEFSRRTGAMKKAVWLEKHDYLYERSPIDEIPKKRKYYDD